MNVTGIIMECNPFHEGHAYLLREAGKLTRADYIVVAMSGDFVQRGEPAVFDKYIRAEQILHAGADLVLELPLYAACGSAEYFARGGIALLDRLGVVTDLCFGSESGDIGNLLLCARILADAEGREGLSFEGAEGREGLSFEGADLYREYLQAGLKSGMPFPAARAAALEQAFVQVRTGCQEENEGPLQYPALPNDLLAVEYCRALCLLGSSIRPHAIPRISVPSATQRRQSLLQNREELFPPAGGPRSGTGSDRIPDLPRTAVTQVPLFPIGPDDFSRQLMYALRMKEGELETYADVSEDLASRIRKSLMQYAGFSSFCDLVKTRNLTRTRISRCLVHILLQMKQERLDTLQSQGMALYVRPLAINRAAAPLLSAVSRKSSLPFLSRLSAAPGLLTPSALSFLEEEIRAEDLYCLTLASAAGASARAGSIPPVPAALQRKIPTGSFQA
jgi:predicted nucleotidyltransferase